MDLPILKYTYIWKKKKNFILKFFLYETHVIQGVQVEKLQRTIERKMKKGIKRKKKKE